MKEDATVYRYSLVKYEDSHGLFGCEMELDDEGDWVAYDEHLSSITDLEYEIRYLKEELTATRRLLKLFKEL